jgi:hypothetical protein
MERPGHSLSSLLHKAWSWLGHYCMEQGRNYTRRFGKARRCLLWFLWMVLEHTALFSPRLCLPLSLVYSQSSLLFLLFFNYSPGDICTTRFVVCLGLLGQQSSPYFQDSSENGAGWKCWKGQNWHFALRDIRSIEKLHRGPGVSVVGSACLDCFGVSLHPVMEMAPNLSTLPR